MKEARIGHLPDQEYQSGKTISAHTFASKIRLTRQALMVLPLVVALAIAGCASQASATIRLDITQIPEPILADAPVAAPTSIIDCNFGPDNRGWLTDDGHGGKVYMGFIIGDGVVSHSMTPCLDQTGLNGN